MYTYKHDELIRNMVLKVGSGFLLNVMMTKIYKIRSLRTTYLLEDDSRTESWWSFPEKNLFEKVWVQKKKNKKCLKSKNTSKEL